MESGPKSTLVGDWHYRDRDQACHYLFGSDNRFSGEVTVRGKLVSKFTGKWSVQGDRLLKIEKNWFLIEAADGSQRRYERGR